MALKFLNDGFFDGKVGIGTATPDAKLQVVQTASANAATFENITQTQSVVTIKTAEVLNNASVLTFSVGDNLASTDIFAQINGKVVSDGGTLKGDLIFQTNQGDDVEERMRISASGNVGIGTGNPIASYDRTLHVKGVNPTVRIETDSATGWAYNQYKSPQSIWSTGIEAFDKFVITNSADLDTNIRFCIDDLNGKVGIGTTTPEYKLHVNSDDASDDVTFIHHNSAGQTSGNVLRVLSDAGDNTGSALLNVGNGTGFAMYARGDRRVGIGTNTPDAGLAVKGLLSLALSGTITISNSSNAVTGTNTAFLTELEVEDAIKIGAEIFTISAIGSNTSLTLDSNVSIASTNVTAFKDPTLLSVRNGDNGVQVIINKSGNVGIGTDSPQQKLHVKAENPILLIQDNSTAVQNASSTLRLAESDAAGDVDVYWDIKQAPDDSGTNFQINHSTLGNALTILSDGKVGIGETAPTEKFVVNGSVNSINQSVNFATGPYRAVMDIQSTGKLVRIGSVKGAVTPTGDEGEVALYVNNLEKVRIDKDGQVGIGTDDPTSKVHIEGANNATLLITRGGVDNVLLGDTGGNNGGDLLLYNSAGVLKTLIRSDADSYLVGGNFGIGTTIPDAKLHVKDTTATAVTLLQLESTYNSPSGNKSIHWSDETDNIGRISVDYTNPMGKMRFGSLYNQATAQTADVMVLQGNGNVGIGTSSPLSNLHIETTNSSAYIQLRRNFTGSKGRLFLGSESAANIIASQGDAVTDAKPLVFQIAEAEKMRIDDTGNVGIGETNPTALLHISGIQDPNVKIQDLDGTNQFSSVGHNNGDMTFVSRNNTADGKFTWYGGGGGTITTRMTLDLDGKLGIGEANPGEKLDVKGGNIRLVDASAGLIFTAPNGKLWKMTISNTGVPVYTDISPQ